MLLIVLLKHHRQISSFANKVIEYIHPEGNACGYGIFNPPYIETGAVMKKNDLCR